MGFVGEDMELQKDTEQSARSETGYASHLLDLISPTQESLVDVALLDDHAIGNNKRFCLYIVF